MAKEISNYSHILETYNSQDSFTAKCEKTVSVIHQNAYDESSWLTEALLNIMISYTDNIGKIDKEEKELEKSAIIALMGLIEHETARNKT